MAEITRSADGRDRGQGEGMDMVGRAGAKQWHRTIGLLLTVSLLLPGCAAPAPSTATPAPTNVIPTRLTAAQRVAILDAAWQTVNDAYFDPTFGGTDWQAIGDAYRQRLTTVEDDDTFWRRVLNPMLFELGVSHIFALPGELVNLAEPETFATASAGMDVRLLDGVPVVTRVDPGSPAERAGLRPGFVVTAVDGAASQDLAASAPQTPPDNERHRRGIAVGGLRAALFGEVGTDVVIDYLDASDQPQRATLRLGPRPGLSCAPLDPATPPACAELEVERLAGGIGYLRLSAFVDGILDQALQAIDDLRDTRALIIDLRGNPGGEFTVRTAIAAKLVGDRELFMRYQYRDGLRDVYLDPVPDAYGGDVVLLVDELSASSSEEFAGSLQALGRATILGVQTPGSCLVLNIVSLPASWILAYPFAQPQTADGRVLEGNGVAPDIAVALDRSELLAGIDAQLQAAIEYVAGT